MKKFNKLIFITILFGLFTLNVYSDSFVMCHDNGIIKSLKIIAVIIYIIKVLIPSFLIVTGMKSLITSMLSNDNNLKDELKKFIKKVVIGVFIFFVPTMIYAFIETFEVHDKSKEMFTDCSLCLASVNYCDNLLLSFPEEKEQVPNRNIELNLEGLSVNPTTVGPVASGTFEVHMINMGHGDAILIRSDSTVILLDAGEDYTTKKVVGYIKKLGVTTIDIVMPSHYCGDHIGGIPAIFKNFKVKKAHLQTDKLALKGGNHDLDPLRGFATKIKAGDVLDFKEFSIKVLGPIKMSTGCLKRGYRCGNSDSLNLLVTFGDTKFFFTGDFVQSNEIIKRFGKEELKNVDLIKQPHHGMGDYIRQRLINIMRPKIVFVSDGGLNLSDQMISWYNKVGASIYRTSKHGNLVAVSDGKTVKVIKKANPNDFRR
ncbi:MAG: MBL fold metallo-hydrolase [Mollicutes bacterium]|nr:MBL fold metallo-hydrolase [Mollicutes bacterium]